MIGTAITAGVGVIGSLIGSAAKARAAKKQRAIIDQQLKDNENWYQRRFNEDSTQRADAQNALRIMRQAMDERTKRAAATGVVAGASDESIAVQKAAANNALGNTVANIVAAGDARKDAIEQQYQENKAGLQAQQGAMLGQQGQNIASLMSQIGGTVTPNLVDAFSKKEDK